jgi:hypothetical protein
VAKNEFIDIRKWYAKNDSLPSAWDYVYRVDGQEVFVEVHASVIDQWNAPDSKEKDSPKEKVSPDDVKRAIVSLIEAKIEKGWSPRNSNRLLLDEFSVKPIALKLGWLARWLPWWEEMAPLLKDLVLAAMLILGIPLLMLVAVRKESQRRLLSILDGLVPLLLTAYCVIWVVRLVQHFRNGYSSSTSQLALQAIWWIFHHWLLVGIVISLPLLAFVLVFLLAAGHTLWNRITLWKRSRRAN